MSDVYTTVRDHITLHPNYYLAGATALAIGIPVLAAKIIHNKFNTVDYQAQKVFKDLLITSWYFPKVSQPNANAAKNKERPIPVLNKETNNTIRIVTEMIVTAKNDRKLPLPNLIFKGKAGVGKTMLVEYICRESGISFVRIPSGAMEHHLKTATHITTLQKIFELAKKLTTPLYIVIDDAEELFAKRREEPKANGPSEDFKVGWLKEKENMGETITQRRAALVNAILEESGKDERDVGFAITTNRAEVIDPAFLTRSRVIEIDPPGAEERKKIIATHLPFIFKDNKDILSFFDMGQLTSMAIKTEGFTGRNIVKMLEDIAACVEIEKAANPELKNGNINQEIVDCAILEQSKSVESIVSTSTLANKINATVTSQFDKISRLFSQFYSSIGCCG